MKKMFNSSRTSKLLALTLLSSILLLAILSPIILSVKAQGQATVDFISTVGGTTDPSGTQTYPDGTVVTLTATGGIGFVFQYWTIITTAGGTSDANNPTTLTVRGGETYAVQAAFQAIQVPPRGVIVTDFATAAIVVVLPAIGGATSPAAGTYAVANAASVNLVAMPFNGWKFDHWAIGGSPLSHGSYSFTATPTDNPYTVDHGYGNTYTYQPVFSLISTSPTPTITPTTTPTATSTGIIGSLSTETIIIIGLVVVIIIILIALAYIMGKNKK